MPRQPVCGALLRGVRCLVEAAWRRRDVKLVNQWSVGQGRSGGQLKIKLSASLLDGNNGSVLLVPGKSRFLALFFVCLPYDQSLLHIIVFYVVFFFF